MKLFFSFLNRFSIKYKIWVFALFFGGFIAGVLEVIGLSVIFPFIAVVSEFTTSGENFFVAKIKSYLNIQATQDLAVLLALMIGAAFIIKNAFSVLLQYLQFHFIMIWRNEICEMLIKKYLVAPITFHYKRASSETINTLTNNVYFVLNSYVMQILAMGSNFLTCVVLIGFIFYHFAQPAIISAIVLVGLVSIQVFFLRKSTRAINQRYISSQKDNIDILQKAITAIKETKVFLKEKVFLSAYTNTNRIVSQNDKMIMFTQYYPPYITETVLIISIIVMCIGVLNNTQNAEEAVAGLAILAATSFRLAPSINRFLYAYSQVRSSSNAMQKLLEELDIFFEKEESLEDEKPMKFQKTLDFKDVRYRYTGTNQDVLKGVSFSIKKSDFIGIVGHSGAGKSTLVDIILGLLTPTNGYIELDGHQLNESNIRGFRRNVGYVAQNPFISSDSVRNNIAFGLPEDEIDDARVIELLKQVQLYDVFKNKPDQFNTGLGENGVSLSGGQRQRVAIARALYHNPEIIILDEATSALDVETENIISETIQSLKGQKTIIAITHRLSTLKNCERLFYMEDGEIKAIGTFDEVSAQQPRFKRMLELANINKETT